MKLSELEVLNLHAQGGMAEVYRARVANPDGTEKIYAVKKILPQFTKEAELVRMFIEEARVAACLNCEQIVQVFDLVMSDNGEYFIVMEFADGKDVADVIYFAGQRKKRLPISMAVQVARDTLKALHYAYNATDSEGRQLKLVHRDVSPHNIIVTYEGKVKLTDFGIAKVQASANKTMAGVIKGKFGYMSPEQARGKPLDGRSDLFNVGIVLYEAFTGDRLFQGASDLDTLDKMRAAAVPRLPANLGVPAELEALMRRSLERDAANRPPDAQTFERELAAIAEKHRLMTRPSEIVATMREVFPTEMQSKVHVPVQTRHVELKSQLFRDGAPAIPAARAPVSAPAPQKAAPAGAPPPATALPAAVRAGDALPSQRPKGGGAAVRAGGGARALDAPPDLAPPGAGSGAPAAHDDDAAGAMMTRVEDVPPGLRGPPATPRSDPPPRGGDGRNVVVAASPQVRTLHGAAAPPNGGQGASAPAGAPPQPSPPPIPDPQTIPPETIAISPETIVMPAVGPPPPPASLGKPSGAPPPPAALAKPSGPPPPPAALGAPSGPPPPPASMHAVNVTPPPPASSPRPPPPPPADPATMPPTEQLSTQTPSTAAQPAVRVAAPPPVPAVRRPPGFLPGPTRYLVAAALAVCGMFLGGGLMLASQLASAGAVEPDLRTLMVHTIPPAASVVLNGDELGVTPLIVDRRLEDGVHTVRLSAAKGSAISRKVQARPGERAVIVGANLVTAGVVRVVTRPAGAEITLDGDEVGKSPVTIEKVSTDRPHVVEATLEGFNLESANVPTERGEDFTLSLTLPSARGNGTLAIRASSPAEVELDGAPWGTTGPTARPCAPGQHRVVVRAFGSQRPQAYTVTVPPKGDARYYFELGVGAPGSPL
ncbi:MAG: serine/threonine protein kinase [Deltaproteobacteria bacterium]|nr:serine/threonine protein kinase [Deltaproteobacteria bacterium]